MNKHALRILTLCIAGPALVALPACSDDDNKNNTGGMTNTNPMNTGGMNTGGMNTGGMNTGGMNTGGMNTGGMNTGGNNNTGTGNMPQPTNCVKIGQAGAQIVDVTGPLNGGNWTCDKIYKLGGAASTPGPVFVQSGTLNIQAGTNIIGRKGSALVIKRGAKINAQGTATHPIVFTSEKAPGTRARGDWGGMVLLGKAPNNQGKDVPAEGFVERVLYGGTEAAYSCGTLRYVRVEWAGHALKPGNELNGITFYSCGTGTKVEYVQSHMGLDDGIEWFGGGFDAKYLVVTGAADDSLDIDQGFSGKLQHIFVHQDPSVGDNMLEISNNGDSYTATPVTNPMIANATLVGSGAGKTGKSKGMTLKEGTSIELYNSIVANTTNELIRLTHQSTQTKFESGSVKMKGNIMFSSFTPAFKSGGDSKKGTTWMDSNLEAWVITTNGNRKVDPALPSAMWQMPKVVPAAGGTTSTGAAQLPAGFDATTYVGAEKPGTTTPWTKASWINYSTTK